MTDANRIARAFKHLCVLLGKLFLALARLLLRLLFLLLAFACVLCLAFTGIMWFCLLLLQIYLLLRGLLS